MPISDFLPGPIRGISRTSVWRSWKVVRRDLKNSSIRDVVDFLDYDVNPDVWINRLLAQIASGDYEPEIPRRFTLGKSKGFGRTMTLPAIPDLVLYRTVVDFVYTRSRKRKYKNVYFLRDELSRAQKQAMDEARKLMSEAKDVEEIDGRSYFTGRKSYYNWLRFDQYRKHLLYEEAHPYIVVTDVANFFDTVLHSHVARALQSLPVPPRMVGLLFFLLEKLSIRQDYASSRAISLPTDEFDCSRTLAHMVLFAHDDAMVRLVGEANYVRWMDDQNMAVGSRAKGLKVLSEVGRSLARLHLSPNIQKSKVLSLDEAQRHYHLDINGMLDEAEALLKKAGSSIAAKVRFERKVKGIWRKARRLEGVGEFAKILKRLYRLAGLAQLGFLRDRAVSDILADPALVHRIADYYRCTGSVVEYLDFVDHLMKHPEQVYPDVNIAVTESLLRLEPGVDGLARIRRLTASLIRRAQVFPGMQDCAAVAALLALRFGNAAIRRLLKNVFEERIRPAPRHVVRAAAFVYACESTGAYREVARTASSTLRNHLSTLVRLIAEIRKYRAVPERYRNRLVVSSDTVAGVKYVDIRVVLTARLLLLSPATAVHDWVIRRRDALLLEKISPYERRLIRKLIRH